MRSHLEVIAMGERMYFSKIPEYHELFALKMVLLIPIVLSIFSKDQKIIGELPIKTKEPYVEMLQIALDNAHKELAKQELRLKQLRLEIIEQDLSQKGLSCLFSCNGYSHQFHMRSDLLRAELMMWMKHFLGQDVLKYIKTTNPEHLQ
jgi:hypothetical protein